MLAMALDELSGQGFESVDHISELPEHVKGPSLQTRTTTDYLGSVPLKLQFRECSRRPLPRPGKQCGQKGILWGAL